MRRKKILQLRKDPPKSPHCPACLLTDEHLKRHADVYECSRVECPKRSATGVLRDWGKP